MAAMSEQEHRTLRQELEAVRDDLKGVADEIRVKLHLAEMDAKDAWSELQPKLENYEKRIEGVSKEVVHELRGIGEDLKSELEKLRKRIG